MGRIGRPQTSKAPDSFLVLLPIPKVTLELEGPPRETEGGGTEHERQNLWKSTLSVQIPRHPKCILQNPHALKLYISVSTLKHTHPQAPLQTPRQACSHTQTHTTSHTRTRSRTDAHTLPHARTPTPTHAHAHTRVPGTVQSVFCHRPFPDLLIGEVFMSCAPLLTPGTRSLGGRGAVHLRCRRWHSPRSPWDEPLPPGPTSICAPYHHAERGLGLAWLEAAVAEQRPRRAYPGA